MNPAQIKRFAARFRIGLLNHHDSRDCRFIVSAPLASLLEIVGVAAKLVSGVVKVRRRAPGLATADEHHHYWIQLSGNLILDATADQFRKPGGARMPAIYLGPRPSWYEDEKP